MKICIIAEWQDMKRKSRVCTGKGRIWQRKNRVCIIRAGYDKGKTEFIWSGQDIIKEKCLYDKGRTWQRKSRVCIIRAEHDKGKAVCIIRAGHDKGKAEFVWQGQDITKENQSLYTWQGQEIIMEKQFVWQGQDMTKQIWVCIASAGIY